MNRDFTAAIDRAAHELGAMQGGNWYAYQIETQAGTLHFSASPSSLGPGGQFVSRFEDVDRAVALLNPRRELQHFSQLNPHSGKWNLILYDAEPEDAYRRVLAHVRQVLKR